MTQVSACPPNALVIAPLWLAAGLELFTTMRLNTLVSLVAALAVAADSKPLDSFHGTGPSRHVIHEEIPHYEGPWTRANRLHEAVTLPVRIGLTQQNLHRAEEFINDVAHPDSPNYGKHWSPQQVVEMFKPRKESVDAVMEWLAEEGIHPSRIKLSTSKTWLTFDASAGEVEQMLKTEYHVFKHDTSEGAHHIACDKYHIPAHLVEHIDIITPTVHFDQHLGHDRQHNNEEVPEEKMGELRKRMALERRGSRPYSGIIGSALDATNPKKGRPVGNAMMDLRTCDGMITPSCLRALYNMPRPGTIGPLNRNNRLGIVEYTPQAFLQSDLDTFFTQFNPRAVGVSPNVVLVANGIVQTENQSFSLNGESALDLQYSMGLIFPQEIALYQVGDTVQGASFNNFLDGIDGSYCTFQGGGSRDSNIDGQYDARLACGSTRPTSVISTSYGSNEADLTPRYESRQCDEYMKLGLQGISIIYSSGDFGVAGNSDMCLSETGPGLVPGNQGRFNPSFPGGCPWVTSVGATQINNGTTVREAEVACQTVIRSGGGFSNVFQMPNYQAQAVGTYFQLARPNFARNKFNGSGRARGFPDVSVNGANYVTAVNGKFSLSYGTSASAPVFASMINMINERRASQRKNPVGFLNPALYANPRAMNDIVRGANPGCGTQGFLAGPGWDPLTGLGTPNYAALESMFLSLP